MTGKANQLQMQVAAISVYLSAAYLHTLDLGSVILLYETDIDSFKYPEIPASGFETEC